jgi:hypothetical protein
LVATNLSALQRASLIQFALAAIDAAFAQMTITGM